MVDFLYTNAPGRLLMKVLQKVRAFVVLAWFLKTPVSKLMVPNYIKKNNIDMTPFAGQKYRSFAEFFGRTKEVYEYERDADVLISPCDGLLSIYPIKEDLVIPMKGSWYTVNDLIPEKETAELFKDGLCMVFRLQARDYHHFCMFDDAKLSNTHYIPGQLHSVQPIACDTVPVFRLNRRWWTLLETAHFGTAAQIEVGAMSVGGVTFVKENGELKRGEEMGNFELAGSTIIVLLDASVSQRLHLHEAYKAAVGGNVEVPVTMGQGVGRVQ